MPDLIQSLKTKFELVIICLTLAGMMATGVYVYSSQTAQINSHEKKIHQIELKADHQDTETRALADVVRATVIPSITAQGKDIHAHHVRLEAMEKSARADREILVEIRNDLKWLRERSGK